MGAKKGRSGHGRIYIDKDGELKHDYREGGGITEKGVKFFLDIFYEKNPHIKDCRDKSKGAA